MSKRRDEPFNWVFWLQWVLATTVGWLIGGAFLPVEIGAGLAVGLLQGLILRPMIARTGWW
ncbi:MAG: hypothetical protein U9Q82_06290, partial [Chloroflexota bacterium]|nr:hypothetical protein [Chloroflexota bacterium]